MVKLFEKIKDEQLKSFAYRVWNTFKSVILPIVLPLVAIQLENNPNDLSCLLEGEFWTSVAYAVVVALIGGAIAGLDKVSRMRKS
jgi:hypothetical protein